MRQPLLLQRPQRRGAVFKSKAKHDAVTTSKANYDLVPTYVANDILHTVQPKRKSTVATLQAGNSDLRIVDNRLGPSPRYGSRGELERKVVKVGLVATFVLVVLVPLGSVGLFVAVIHGGGSDGGEAGKEGSGGSELHRRCCCCCCCWVGVGVESGQWAVDRGCWSGMDREEESEGPSRVI